MTRTTLGGLAIAAVVWASVLTGCTSSMGGDKMMTGDKGTGGDKTMMKGDGMTEKK
jgi:hypothetical protein